MSSISAPLTVSDDAWLESALQAISNVEVIVCGDVGIDAYWHVDAAREERSVETGLPVQVISRQVYSLGGAANVAANAAALGAAVGLLGVVGDDPFGLQLRRLCQAQGIDAGGVLTGAPGQQTMVYAKPMRGDAEQPRLDFGSRIADADLARLALELDRAAAGAAAVVVNQQCRNGLEGPLFAAAVNAAIARHPGTVFVVDAREAADRFRGAVLKLNAAEAARLADGAAPADGVAVEDSRRHALALAAAGGRPVFLTRGERGLLVADRGTVVEVPGIQATTAVDPVGAGDTAVAAIAAALGAGLAPEVAARLANLAAAVTVRKLGTTGTATPAEIRALGPRPDHVWEPELAEDPRRARREPGSDIEVVRRPAAGLRIRHAIFDHDGTISTLRQGWERIMEPMMVRAILGARHADAEPRLRERAMAAARGLIDRTTGIQTLVQMQHLTELVRGFGCVAAGDVLDAHGYKALYNAELMEMVRQRRVRLERGELAPEDFLIKNARVLLERLRAAGVVLHLASGTDQADVIDEARAMGYAHLFAGIHGAVGDPGVEAKRVVMDRILRETAGAAFAVFGDGPVELREGRKRGGVCVGVASDEVRRFGLDAGKRARLIRAGADVVVGDYSQLDALLRLIGM